MSSHKIADEQLPAKRGRKLGMTYFYNYLLFLSQRINKKLASNFFKFNSFNSDSFLVNFLNTNLTHKIHFHIVAILRQRYTIKIENAL